MVKKFSGFSSPKGRRWGMVRTVASMLILFFVVPVLTTGQLKNQKQLTEPNYNSLTYEARRFLESFADAQVLYFADHNEWAGYKSDKNVFETLNVHPVDGTRYAYYCGDDYIVPDKGESKFNYPTPGPDWPYGLHPEITLYDFVCIAIGNNDRDTYPDVWMINKFKQPTHLLDDNKNEILVDIVSEPFDPRHFYANKLKGGEGEPLSRLYIEINLPAYRLDLFEDGRRLKSYTIAIGMKGFKTPLRTFYIERMEWNPWWIPPRAAWCSKKDDDGKEIGCKPVSPGNWNPLGPVKMVMQSAYLVHGTNRPREIGTRASHGCIRLKSENAIDLAWKLMIMTGTKQPIAGRENYWGRSRTTYRVGLLSRVQVNTVYKRLEVLGKSLLLHPDTYGWQPLTSEAIDKRLVQFGIAPRGEGEGGEPIIKRDPTRTVSVPIDL